MENKIKKIYIRSALESGRLKAVSDQKFDKAGIEIPFPQQEITYKMEHPVNEFKQEE